jgi:pyridoxine 5-phosphate synthase
MHYLRDVIKELQDHEIEVSLFVDPVARQIEAARDLGADKIEIHTGAYARARNAREVATTLEEIRSAASLAAGFGLGVNAGHGLNYVNIKPIRQIQEIEEVSIGHAIIVRAIFSGLENAVREMVKLVR